MALPSLDNPTDKGQVQEIISDIATAVFKSAKVSLESAAKMVVPSVPEMVDDVLQDLLIEPHEVVTYLGRVGDTVDQDVKNQIAAEKTQFDVRSDHPNQIVQGPEGV